MAQLPVVTGVTAKYYGPSGAGTTAWSYWVQAIYPEGNSPLSAAATTPAKCPAAFSSSAFLQVQWNPAPGAIGYLVWRATASTLPVTGGVVIFVASSQTGIKDDGSLSSITTSPRYDGLYVAKAIYNFSVDGGAIGAIIPALSDSIPANAIVFGGYANPTTALTSGGAATIAIGTAAGSSASSLKAATAVATYSIDAILPLTPVFSAGTAFKMTAAGQINITVAAFVLTAGILEIFVFYTIAANA